MAGTSRRVIVRRLRETARLLELAGESPFRARAYENAARTLEDAPESPEELLESGRLAELPGIGPGLASAVAELVTSGRLSLAEELEEQIPRGLLELYELSGLGSKRIRKLRETLGVTDLQSLEAACRDGRVAPLPGFGPRLQEALLAAIAQHQRYRERHLLSAAWEQADQLMTHFRSIPDFLRFELAGSLRRGMETVGDLDFVVVPRGEKATDELAQALAARVGGHWVATPRNSLWGSLEGGWRVDVFLARTQNFGWTLLEATGPEAFLQGVWQRAKEKGLEPSQTGLLSTSRPDLAFFEEESVFQQLELPWVPPELRDLAARTPIFAGAVSSLITLEDLTGTFHVHTNWSDGRASLSEMAEAARQLGWSYLGIADHSQSAGYAGGLSPERVWSQWEAIATWNQSHPELQVFRGIEADILPDGCLDYEDDLLLGFDFVVASIHSRLHLGREKMTERLIRAVEHPAVTFLGHPSGRLLLQREPYEADLPCVFEAARHAGVVVELNASPYRLDADWRLLSEHLAAGGLISIHPDAHSVGGLNDVRFGVIMARKAGASQHQVVNTWPRERVQEFLKERRARAREKISS